MLAGILPRILPDDMQIRYVVFQGKQDLEKKLEAKLRGWMLPSSRFVVLRDQDSGDCKAIKAKLVQICSDSGKDGVLVRIACRELESFFLGDLAAVAKGLGLKGLKTQQGGKKFRNPDALGNPAGELFRLTGNASSINNLFCFLR